MWGLFPLYWRMLDHVEALEVLCHRIIWSLVAVALIVSVTQRWTAVAAVLSAPRVLGLLTVSTLLLALNWGLGIWAVHIGQVIQSSMGYFLAPLTSVLFGLLVFHERLNARQWVAVALAGAGVAHMIFVAGIFPWLALALGVAFGAYGALRKLAQADSITGLFVETMLIAPVALGAVVWWRINGTGAFLATDTATTSLLILTGAIATPALLAYIVAAKKLELSTVGILSYLTPSLQFLLGVAVFGESVTSVDVVTFGLIWLGLIVYTVEQPLRFRLAERAPSTTGVGSGTKH